METLKQTLLTQTLYREHVLAYTPRLVVNRSYSQQALRMDTSHKRLIRVGRHDYAVAKDRLMQLAQEDGRELWYDERKEMIVFRGETLKDLEVFAAKCSQIIKSIESARLTPEDLARKEADMAKANEMIGTAINFAFKDKLQNRRKFNST